VKELNSVEAGREGRVLRFDSLRLARALHGPTGRVASLGTRREKVKADTWQNAIGQQDFNLILSLNSIISLQTIIIFFYIKIHDFFFVYKY
jgi:hypothetical protein